VRVGVGVGVGVLVGVVSSTNCWAIDFERLRPTPRHNTEIAARVNAMCLLARLMVPSYKRAP
jgi:hypothetical protein